MKEKKLDLPAPEASAAAPPVANPPPQCSPSAGTQCLPLRRPAVRRRRRASRRAAPPAAGPVGIRSSSRQPPARIHSSSRSLTRMHLEQKNGERTRRERKKREVGSARSKRGKGTTKAEHYTHM